MKLAKLHGLGNDFLICRADQDGAESPPPDALARELCRRRTGIGADGMVLFRPTVGDREADVSALIYNADGSRAEMSGNGIRCLAAYLVHSGDFPGPVVRVRTVSGIRCLRLTERRGRVYSFETTMGRPITDPAKMRLAVEAAADRLVDYPLATDRGEVRATICSMGNPHCSTFWPDAGRAPVEHLGPVLERLSLFPDHTNVEFVEVLDRHRIRVRFWERGVGRTPASGTGSAAAAVAAILNHFADSPVTVETESGDLLVHWDPPGELVLTGPAEYICACEREDETAI
jgi:diaminopimelate epimerase